mmetsp:Transcript_22130/g.49468  ORF Transcript_22130/g.49468 Transcript_22130/m.49468 type:complete len:649 (+) Transcript_22130:98-2044(+)
MVHRWNERKNVIGAVVARAVSTIIAMFFVATTVDAVKRVYNPPEECGLYLAPSSIPGAGLGMYAGSTKYGEDSLVSDGDLMIPTWDLDYHNGNDVYYHLWDEYTWSTSMFPGMLDDVESMGTTSTISSGFGAAINCMMPLVNVADEEWDLDSAYRLTRSGVSSDSPGAGAFTPMTGRRFSATQTIQPFSELYASYGEGYFDGRSVYDFVPFNRHYVMADKLINSFIDNVTLWQKDDTAEDNFFSSQNFEEELWDFIVQLRDVWDKTKVMFALPGDNTTTIDVLKNLLDVGGSKLQGYNDTVKDQEWMDEHGQCMDNTRDGISNNPDAGRGAFASRFIPKGGLVAPAPLIHIPNRTSLTIYDHMITPIGKWKRNVDSPAHHQLLLNYCFGHRDSLLLLCPYGYQNFLMNHDHKNPNTKVVWTDKKRLRHPEWFEMAVSDWGGEFHSGLALDFVALRDIEKGEEITIDYGIEWETAWQEHVRNFDRPRRGYRPAFELNEMIDLRIPTAFESIEKQFPDVITFCHDYYFPENHTFTPYKFDTDEDKDEEASWHYTCRVLMRHNDDKYTVEIFARERWMNKFEMYERNLDRPQYILFDVPRDAIFFRDRVYARDHHQPWSFRHDMRLPDEIFPEIWKDYKKEPKQFMTKASK